MGADPRRHGVNQQALSDADDTEVRASVITALPLGTAERRPGSMPALRLNDASITGQLSLAHADVRCPCR